MSDEQLLTDLIQDLKNIHRELHDIDDDEDPPTKWSELGPKRLKISGEEEDLEAKINDLCKKMGLSPLDFNDICKKCRG